MDKTKQVKRVVSRNNLPTNFPLWQTLVIYLLLKDGTYHGPTALLLGFVIGAVFLWWIFAILKFSSETQIDVFNRIDTIVIKGIENLRRIK